MTTFALLNAFAYVDSHDFTGDTNQLQLQMEVEALDKTTFRSNGWRERAGGLKTSTLSMQGFFQAGTGQVDPHAFDNLGVRDLVHTMGPAETEGEIAYLWRAGHFSYQLLGELGTVAPFTLGSQGTDGVGVVRGELPAAMQDVSATGQLGTALTLPAATSTQSLYGTFHVFEAGTSITVDIESSPDNTFASPTTQATIGPLTATGGTWVTPVAGPISDTWYRFNVTALTGTFSVAGALGIQ